VAYPERIVPDATPSGIVALHLKRYDFARAYCDGSDVLDAGCGVGYGTAHLAEVAASVVGVDVSAEAVAYATKRYAGPRTSFRKMDVTALDFPDATFDVVCSFETLEHVPDREQYLGEVVRMLRDGGAYVVSTPRADETTESPDNPYHCVEYSRDDFEALLRRRFGSVEVYGQRRLQTRRHRTLQRLDVLGLRRRAGLVRRLGKAATGTEPTQSVTLEDLVIERRDLDTADVLVAVCTQPRPG
jgi:SAM-dependent methyltransferase